jgi:hypothetical protein
MALRDIRCDSWRKFPFIYRDGYVEQIRVRECKLGHGWTLNATVHDSGPEIWWEVALNPPGIGSTVESHTGTARTSEQAIAEVAWLVSEVQG